MAAILTDDHNPQIRAAIDPTLDAGKLPDAVIGMTIYRDAADLDVKALVPDWETIVADTGTSAYIHLINALIYLTAAKIVPALPDLLGETWPDYAYKVQRPTLAEQARRLTALAMAAIGLATGTETASRLPTFFTIARGTRVSTGR